MPRRRYGYYYGRFPPKSSPIRTTGGIRARTQRGRFGQTWWAGRWLAALEQITDAGRLSRGRSYARNGQVLTLEVSGDGVSAQVQGSWPEPYSVSISFQRLNDGEWERVVDALAGRAIYAARLLNGEMPDQVEEVFGEAGVSLFPSGEDDLESDCSCPDWSNPCKHVAAVYYLLGERFDDDPFLIFELRGRSKAAIVGALRERRTGGAATVAGSVATEAGEEAEAPPLLAGSAASFWRTPSGMPEPALSFVPPEVDAIAVKRLGAPPFWPPGQDYAHRMERGYHEIAVQARRRALGEEPVERERTIS